MRVCDRCYPNKVIEAYDNILVGSENMYIYVFKSCKEELLEFISSKKEVKPELEEKPRRGRPSKNSAPAEYDA